MGCICCKPSTLGDSREANATARSASLADVALGGGERREKQLLFSGYDAEKRREKERERERAVSYLRYSHSLSERETLRAVPKAVEGEQVAAGWPPWLSSVAGEAIRGWVPRRADSFEKLDKIGQGTYSNVYRARDLDGDKIVALKKVRFDNLEPESVRFMAREILILRRLDHPNIIKLEGLVTSRMSCSLYLVFEYMEHDLAGLASFPGIKFTEQQIKCYMQQLLRGLEHCHSRGVLHRDIKGSNLLIDNKGVLKIADFGLASFFDPAQKNPLTSRVVTLWYRPPELLLGATSYSVAVDLWSTGCILAELYAGKPIMPGRTEVEQLHKIFKLCGSPSEEYWTKSKLPHATIFKPQQPYQRRVAETFKDFPVQALALIDLLLSIEPADRGTASSALKCQYFMTKPFACDPSSLPKYPPSKEFDAKRREEEFRSRKGSMVSKIQPEKRQRESRAIPAPEANAELASSMLKKQAQGGSKSRSKMFNSHTEEAGSGFRIEPRPVPVPENVQQRQHFFSNTNTRSFHSGPLVNPTIIQSSTDKRAPPHKMVAHARRSSEVRRNYEEETKDQMIVDTDATIMGYGSKGSKIHYSGPLVRASGNVDQMLKDHDRQIQEVFRRSRGDKSRAKRLHGDGPQPHWFGYKRGEHSDAPPVYPSSHSTSIPSLTSHLSFGSTRGLAE
ncbi:Protein kinase superfamily protein [Rhynchospora pubera]|uniref:[RNA-polymerase]-subunit kinase n=1 Tax=Rhynchospora pubera TaxID=906938 RepID=A0AAV8HWS7_9POAL|nr:Protein kinase superfamily protein [Rhynchospora pubera]